MSLNAEVQPEKLSVQVGDVLRYEITDGDGTPVKEGRYLVGRPVIQSRNDMPGGPFGIVDLSKELSPSNTVGVSITLFGKPEEVDVQAKSANIPAVIDLFNNGRIGRLSFDDDQNSWKRAEGYNNAGPVQLRIWHGRPAIVEPT